MASSVGWQCPSKCLKSSKMAQAGSGQCLQNRWALDGQRAGGRDPGQGKWCGTHAGLDYTQHTWDIQRKHVDRIEKAFRKV